MVTSTSKTETPQDEPPYTDGPSRVVLINDGEKDFTANLNMVFAINEAEKHIWRDLGSKRKPVDEAKFEITMAKVFVENAEETQTLARPASYANVGDAEVELKEMKLKLEDAEKRYTEMKEGLDPFKNNLKTAQIHVQGNMEEALQGVRLLDPSELDEEPLMDDTSVQAHSKHESTVSNTSECVEPDQEALFRKSVRQKMDHSHWTLQDIEAKFDYRHIQYERMFAMCNREFGGGEDSNRIQSRGVHIQATADKN